MIKLFTGIPGCGKTYRAVYELMQEKDKYYIFHNIPGLKHEKINEGKYIKSWSEIDEPQKFFTLDNQTKLSETIKDKYGKRMLLIIDEAQGPLGKFNSDIKNWMAYHRHLGQDIWIITHDKFNIDKTYHPLIEIEIKGKRGFIFNSFIYSYMDHGERIKSDRLPKDKEIFDLYESYSIEETPKAKSKLFLFMLVCALIAVGIGIYFAAYRLPASFKKVSAKEPDKVKPSDKKETQPETGSMVSGVRYVYVGEVNNQILVADPSGNIWNFSDISEYRNTFIDPKTGAAIAYDTKANAKILRYEPIRGDGEGAGRATGSPPNSSTTDSGKYIKKIIIVR